LPTSVLDAASWGEGGVRVLPFEMNSASTTISASSVVQQVSQGAYFVLGRNNTLAAWRNMQTPFLLTDTSDVTTLAVDAGVAWPMSAAYDTSFTPKLAIVSGMAPGSTMRVELMVCIEIEPSIASVFRDIAKVPANNYQLNEVQKTEAALARAPIAGPLSWSDTIIDIIQGAAKVGKVVFSML